MRALLARGDAGLKGQEAAQRPWQGQEQACQKQAACLFYCLDSSIQTGGTWAGARQGT